MKGWIIVATLFLASPALAVDRAACVDASSKTQDLRAASKLVEAREQALICASSDCPAVVSRDCSQWLTEIEQVLPSVSIAPHDANGADLVAVKVFVDDQLWFSTIDGRARFLNPGAHKFRFEADGLPSTVQNVVIREGEKGRAIVVTLGEQAKSNAAQPNKVVIETAPPQPSSHATWMKPFGIAALTLGAVTLAVGGVLAGVAASEWGQATGTCPITQPCTDTNARSQQGTAGTLADWSTALFVGGGVIAATGLVFIIVAPKSSESAHVAVVPTANGLTFSLSGKF